MIEGALILKMAGDAYFGPTWARQTLRGIFTLQVENTAGSPTLTVDVLTRNRADTGWQVAGTFSSITADGVYHLDVTSLEELVKLKYAITAASATAGMHVYAPTPQWLID